MEQRSRSRASTEPYIDQTDGHVVDHKAGRRDIPIALEFRRRRYHSSDFLAALLGRHPKAMSRTCRRLKVKGVDVLQLCERQREIVAERTVGTLYYELNREGYAILSEEGIIMPDQKEDKIFAHTLCLDQVMASLEIGVRATEGVEIEYRDDLPRKLPLPKRDGKEQWMISDHAPFSFVRNGRYRNIAGVEIDTGSMPIATKDKNRTAIVHKFEHIIYLIQSGAIEKHYKFGRKFFFLFIFRTEARMHSAMDVLMELTKRDPELRQHFLFKRHPIYGKSKDKPQATGHMFTTPWARAGFPPLYLNGGGISAQ